MRRLAEDARALLDEAAEIARTYRHAEVELEHVLAAVTSGPRHRALLARYGFEVTALDVVVRDRLSDVGQLGTYRDGSRPPRSARLERFVAASCARRGILDLFGHVTTDRVVDELFSRPEILSIALNAPIRIVSSETALLLAQVLAASRNHRLVTLRHLARVLANDPEITEACAPNAVDELGEIRRGLDRELTPGKPGFIGREIDVDLRRVLFVVRPSATRYARRLLAGVLAEDEVADLFFVPYPADPVTDAVLRALDVGPAPVAGDETIALRGAIANDAEVEVVFFDDDFTTMELVVEILRDCFQLTPAAAQQAMMMVHESGQHVVARLPAHEAKHRIGIARATASRSGAPLRIGIRVVDDGA